MAALRAVKIASDSGDVIRTAQAVQLFLTATNNLTVEAVSIMGLMPELYDAATDVEFKVFIDGAPAKWLESELKWVPEGTQHKDQTGHFSPTNVGVDSDVLVGLRAALHPGWKAPGQP